MVLQPPDNGIGRDPCLALCWPGHVQIEVFDLVRLHASGDEVVVTYVQHRHDGSVAQHGGDDGRNGRIVVVEVYFGWSLPYPAAPGTHRVPDD